MNRRTFLNWVGVGWLASSLPVAIAACSSQTTEKSAPDVAASPPATANPKQPEAVSPQTPAKKPTPAGKFQPVGTTKELDKTGQLLKKDSPVGPVLVVGKSTNPELIAVNPTCTHAGCLVEWLADGKKFVCPCHGSEFAVDGKVLLGMTSTPLKIYTAKIEGSSVLVQ
jgi:cytochrome b6-f complex iron-sulfur subunit